MRKSFTWVIFSLFVLLAPAPSCCAAEKTPEEKFGDATALMSAQKFSEAVPILQDLGEHNPTASVFWNLGISAAAAGNKDVALQAWLAYRKADPDNWQARSKLVQSYQALDKPTERDQERANLIALWQAGTDATLSAQQLYCREQFVQDGRKVMAFEYFNPSGKYMVFYSFAILNDAGQAEYKLSLGSYETTNQIALELGDRPKDKRLYHLDLYRDNVHETYGMYLGQPGYDEIRHTVADIIAGKTKPMSGSVMPSKPAS